MKTCSYNKADDCYQTSDNTNFRHGYLCKNCHRLLGRERYLSLRSKILPALKAKYIKRGIVGRRRVRFPQVEIEPEFLSDDAVNTLVSLVESMLTDTLVKSF